MAEWISVENEVPLAEAEYLVFPSDDGKRTAWYRPGHKGRDWSGWYRNGRNGEQQAKVTH